MQPKRYSGVRTRRRTASGTCRPEEPAPQRPLEHRHSAEEVAGARAQRPVAARHHPRGRPLEQREVPDDRLEGRHDLEGRRPRPHDRHARPGQVEAFVPPRRMEDGPLEAVEAGDLREARLGEGPRRGHQHVGRVRTVAGLDTPARTPLVPHGLGDVVAEADVREDAEALGHVAEVGPDLGLRREPARPAWVRRERERVEVRLHVAGGAGVTVIAPHPAHVVGTLQHDEVADPRLPQPDGRAEPGEAGTDDGDVNVGDLG